MGLRWGEDTYKHWNKVEIKNAFVDYLMTIHNDNTSSKNSYKGQSGQSVTKRNSYK